MSDTKQQLLAPYQLGDLKLTNKVVMASLTRCRVDNAALAPTALQAGYYAQRAGAGLIITEGTWVSKKGTGFINVPGIYSAAQVAGWKLVTDAVHAKAGKIFLQMGHSGAASHPDFFDGELPSGPSAINPQEKTYTPAGFKETVTPKAFTIEEIKETIQDYKLAALNAKAAGFDGVEIHAQIFTLIPQFLSAATNQRTDQYGGSIENRARFLFELLDALKQVYDSKQIGIKFSPAHFNPGILKPDLETIPMFEYLLDELNNYDLAYIQIAGPTLDLKGTVLEALKDNYFSFFRKIYKGTLMANLGFNQETGNAIVENGLADLVSFGTLYISNPDLVYRFENNLPLAAADQDTFYTAGEKGYADYPAFTES